MNFFKKILKAIFNIVIVLILFIAILIIYNYFQIVIFNKHYSVFLGYTFFEVSTGSMAGTIEVHDIVLVKLTQDVKENDIITYLINDEIITHRVIKVDKNGILTKGDANSGEDKIIKQQNIIGKVVKIIPKLGIWISVFTDIKVIVPMTITIVLFGLALSTKEKTKEKKSFSRFMRNRREKRNGKSKEKKKS